jgi:hypothetical protein
MRTLSEILKAARDNEQIEVREARYALCVMDALSTFDTQALKGHKVGPFDQFAESFRRWKAELGKSPDQWLGWDNDPENPECQRRRDISKKLYDRIVNDGTE